MNIEVICPVCGGIFKTAVAERELDNYEKRVRCSSCWKSFFLQRAEWRIVGKKTIEAVVLVGQKKDSSTRIKARGKWSKKVHGEMVKRIERRNEAKSATSDLEVRKLPVLKARSEVSKGEYGK